MIIEFFPYRLVPIDERNWKMQHWHASARGKDAGVPKWHDTGSFFSKLGQALEVAWQREMRLDGDIVPRGLEEAMRKAEDISDRLMSVTIKEDEK